MIGFAGPAYAGGGGSVVGDTVLLSTEGGLQTCAGALVGDVIFVGGLNADIGACENWFTGIGFATKGFTTTGLVGDCGTGGGRLGGARGAGGGICT